MLEIAFTADDLARVSIGHSLGPLGESVQAMGALGRGSRSAWVTSTRRRQSRREREVAHYLRPLRSVGVDLFTLTPVGLALDEARFALRESPAEWLAAELGAFRRNPAADPPWLDRARKGDEVEQRRLVNSIAEWQERHLAKWWYRIRDDLEAKYARLSRDMLNGGVHRLMQQLAPGAFWDAHTLRIPAAAAWTTEPLRASLSGRGLVVVPSCFASVPEPYFPIDQSRPSVLIVPTTCFPRTHPLPPEPTRGPALGRTRSAVLHALSRRSFTTSQLAAHLDISLSSASQHTKALRRAGLVITERDGIRVWHAATVLGQALHRRGSPDPEAFNQA
jgi:DNA-binding transcriptional ArsR family regulator